MNDWRKIQRENFISLEKLSSFLELDSSNREKVLKKTSFPLNLPLRLAKKIQKNNLEDPLFKQFVPIDLEEATEEGFSFNPVGDIEAFKTPKCLQKYESRVLLLPTSACVMNCRFCFRRHFPYEHTKTDFSEEVTHISQDSSIKEVILSGGDPLSLSDPVLEKLMMDLDHIPHLKRLRFHTRFPIGIPERIQDTLLSFFRKSRLQIWFLVHCNHPTELDDDVLLSLKKIRQLAIPVLSQTVLLKGVNDSIETLKKLFEMFVDEGIVPYYLHQLDRVQGARHFEVSELEGKRIMEGLQKQLSGYALPRYVKEIKGEPSKSLI